MFHLGFECGFGFDVRFGFYIVFRFRFSFEIGFEFEFSGSDLSLILSGSSSNSRVQI